nr:MAG TPA: hypothetical protein [Caudoviricetes sp.]
MYVFVAFKAYLCGLMNLCSVLNTSLAAGCILIVKIYNNFCL